MVLVLVRVPVLVVVVVVVVVTGLMIMLLRLMAGFLQAWSLPVGPSQPLSDQVPGDMGKQRGRLSSVIV